MVPAGVWKHDFLKWQNDSSLRRRLFWGPRIDFGLALDGQDHLVVLVDQVGPERLGASLRGAPFDDEYDGHAILGSREIGGPELVENAGHIEFPVITNAGFITGQGKNQVHKAADNAWVGCEGQRPGTPEVFSVLVLLRCVLRCSEGPAIARGGFPCENRPIELPEWSKRKK